MNPRQAATRAVVWLARALRGQCTDQVALREARRELRSTAHTPSLMAELLEGDVD